MSIRLILSSRKPYNTTYHTEEGQVIYKVEAARPTLGSRTIKISKAIPTFVDDRVGVAPQDGKDELSKDSFGHLATIDYRMVQNSQIRMGSTMDVSTGEYFKKEGWNFLGRSVVLCEFGAVMPLSPQHSGIVFLRGQTAGNISGSWELWFARQVIPRFNSGFERKIQRRRLSSL